MKLAIHNLSVTLGKERILTSITMEIPAGSYTALLGPSGAGKTTLLRAILGLLPIDEGEIQLGEEKLHLLPPQKRNIAVVFQDLGLFPHMTVEENLCFPLKMQKIPQASWKQKVKEILSDVRLEGFERRPIQSLSGGQQQRLALARALITRPSLLLLDEPFSSLDPNLRLEMRQLVRRLQEEKSLTVLMITHDKEDALDLADQVALLKEGHLLQIDKPQEILERPQTKEVARFMGEVNFLKVKVEQGLMTSELFSGAVPSTLADGTYHAVLPQSELKVVPQGETTHPWKVQAIHYRHLYYQLELVHEEYHWTAIITPLQFKQLQLIKGQFVGVEFPLSAIWCLSDELR